ncbi:MAG: CCA tRNA nucleotidyltransferase [Candidatus Odinarchaeum yellowstonii]|uniref:CCA-adding enzyme n=1 Tax=Odinarchaeota yellowstonii (strain LCB_4) TaxID=1841599 RepID=A0AAF0D325_ODILC|nr:MAG: CCA tRNA nucleotidyltransferase [Candidatus Odinarchaeum yellowstonii]
MNIEEESLNTLLAKIKERIKPSRELTAKVDGLVNEVKTLICKIVEENNIPVEITLTGSYAKGTWLPQKLEVDVFLMYNSKKDIANRGVTDLEYFKKIFEHWEDRHAQHPYISGVYKGLSIDIVPAVKIRDSTEKVTAVDRSPLHTKYVLSKVNDEMKGEIRLLKSFLIAQKLYGAEIKTKGFSGYLCELLIIYYKKFLNLLKHCLSWREGEIIILEDVKPEDVKKQFTDPLIVIDPVDYNRNVASPVGKETLQKFIKTVREFLEKPSERFFFPVEVTPLKPEEVKNRVKNMFFIITKIPKIPVDNLWGQLHRSLNGIKKFLELNGFEVEAAYVWSNEKNESVFIFKMRKFLRDETEKKLGPPVNTIGEREFREKYESNKRVKAFYIEDGRWVALIRREDYDLKNFLKNKFKNKLEMISLGKNLRSVFQASFEILFEDEILAKYVENKDFAKFLTELLS